MRTEPETKDGIVYVDGKKYELLDIDESGEHPILNVSPLESEDETEEYNIGLLETDVKYLIWELLSVCSGTYCKTYGELEFLLSNVCYTLQIEYDEAIEMLGDENIIHGEFVDATGKSLFSADEEGEYTAITESQLAYLCTKSPLATAQKLGKFLIDNSAEIKTDIMYDN